MIRSLFLALLLSTINAWAAETVKCKTGGNQSELNACAVDDFQQADKELNEGYQALIKKESKNQVFISKLRGAQRAWLVFRDAELESAFACEQANPRVCWGSMYPINFTTYKATLTRERTKRLHQLMKQGQPDAK